jgi:hypothetical protein
MLSSANGISQAPIVRAKIEPAKGIIVGQPVHLTVEILVPNYFTGSPDLPEFELENAIVVLPQDRPQNTNAQIDGKTYAGISQTYTIYPQQPGDFCLPPAPITVPYASTPPKTTLAHIALPPLTFHADIPEAAQGLNYFLPTTRLTIQQQWSSPFKNIRAGDTIERTITVTATKMQAMLIPPLPLEAPDGVRVYPEEPSVQDKKTDRGEFVFGQRKQAAKYFIQKAGDYTLPAVELQWWNLSANRLVTASLPAVHFIAAANPQYVAELPPEPEPIAAVTKPASVNWWKQSKIWARRIGPYCLAFSLGVWLAIRYLPRLYRRLRFTMERRKQSEAVYFNHLARACRRNDKASAYDWLLKWIGKRCPGTSLEECFKRPKDQELITEVNRLSSSLFESNQKSAQWSGTRLLTCLKKFRQTQVSRPATRTHLPDLNPSKSC